MNRRQETLAAVGVVLALSGILLFLAQEHIFSWILDLTLGFLAVHCLFSLYRWVRTRKMEHAAHAVLSAVFFVFLTQYQHFPEWIIRVSFGAYLLLNAAAMVIQLGIDIRNEIKGRRIFVFAASAAYAVLGSTLLLSDMIDTVWLIRIFALYFLILSVRYFTDAFGEKAWRRKVRVMVPPFVSAFLPDAWLKDVNRHLQEDASYQLKGRKTSRIPRLHVMVHVGPEGFKKIGHISFAWDGLVYSYGNYDSDSFRLNGTLGDGVFFNADQNDYIPNMMHMENNSIFRYGIATTPEQDEMIESCLQQLKDASYRWYTRIEKAEGYDRQEQFEQDYPSRLHLRTGAKMYKFKRGKFRTYWALGDNCCMFTDLILGKLGADVLNMRGIITPGTYLEFLETEYGRPHSPVIAKTYFPRQS